jgi:hypothetical protein
MHYMWYDLVNNLCGGSVDGRGLAKLKRGRKTSRSGAGGYPVWLVLMQVFAQSTNTKAEAIHMRSILPRVIYGGLAAFDTEAKEWLP